MDVCWSFAIIRWFYLQKQNNTLTSSSLHPFQASTKVSKLVTLTSSFMNCGLLSQLWIQRRGSTPWLKGKRSIWWKILYVTQATATKSFFPGNVKLRLVYQYLQIGFPPFAACGASPTKRSHGCRGIKKKWSLIMKRKVTFPKWARSKICSHVGTYLIFLSSGQMLPQPKGKLFLIPLYSAAEYPSKTCSYQGQEMAFK